MAKTSRPHRSSLSAIACASGMLAAVSLSSRAAAAPLPKDCGTITKCVAAASKEPDAFEFYLREQFDRWTCPELVDGISWKDPKGTRTEVVQALLGQALGQCPVHTESSAQTLLKVARQQQLPGGLNWIAALAKDDVGRWVLGRHLEAAKTHDEIWIWWALQYLFAANVEERAKGMDYLSKEVRAKYESPEETKRLAKFADVLWAAYLELRAPETQGPLNFRPETPAEAADAFNSLFVNRPEFDERFLSLVRTEVAGGRAPTSIELQAYWLLRSRHPGNFDDVLNWAASPHVDIRSRVGEAIVLHTSEKEITGEHRARICSAVRPMLLEPKFPKRPTLVAYMPFCVSGSTKPEQAAMLALVLETEAEWPQDALRLTVALGEVEPAARSSTEEILFRGDLNRTSELVDTIYWHPPTWLRGAIGDWLRTLKATQLSDPLMQERVIMVARLLQLIPDARVPPLPDSRLIRRPRPPEPMMAGLMMLIQKAEAQSSGKPPPPSPPRQTFEPELTPITPQIAAAREQQFILLWETLISVATARPR
jgi:hypothetical protein